MNNHWIFVAASITLAGAALAQTVYESKDRSGPVFTDKPSAGASVVQLQPPNAIAMPAARPAPQASAPAFAYLNLVVAPEAQGTVHTNTSGSTFGRAGPPRCARVTALWSASTAIC